MTGKAYLQEIELNTRWGDQDQYGHINNTVFFRFIEEARVAWFNSLGFDVDGKGVGPILLKTGATFHKELNYPSTIKIRSYAFSPGNSSLPMEHQILDAETGELYCTLEALVVWFDHKTRKSIPLNDKIREKVLSALES